MAESPRDSWFCEVDYESFDSDVAWKDMEIYSL